MLTDIDIKTTVTELLQSKEAKDALFNSGYGDVVNTLTSDPNALYNFMVAYDMSWDISPEDFPERIKEIREILDDAQTGNAPSNVIDALLDYIFRMEKIREKDNSNCVGQIKQCPYRTIVMQNDVETAQKKRSSYNLPEDDTYMVGEPESSYGNASVDTEWCSTKNESRKPGKNKDVLVCGYYLPGVIRYGVGTWTGYEWKCDIHPGDESRAFVVLYWRNLPDLPSRVFEEL